MKTDGKITKTAEERVGDIINQINDLNNQIRGGYDVDNNISMYSIILDALKAHAAEARREALREAADYLRKLPKDMRTRKILGGNLTVDLSELAKAIEQLGGSDEITE